DAIHLPPYAPLVDTQVKHPRHELDRAARVHAENDRDGEGGVEQENDGRRSPGNFHVHPGDPPQQPFLAQAHDPEDQCQGGPQQRGEDEDLRRDPRPLEERPELSSAQHACSTLNTAARGCPPRRRVSCMETVAQPVRSETVRSLAASTDAWENPNSSMIGRILFSSWNSCSFSLKMSRNSVLSGGKAKAPQPSCSSPSMTGMKPSVASYPSRLDTWACTVGPVRAKASIRPAVSASTRLGVSPKREICPSGIPVSMA